MPQVAEEAVAVSGHGNEVHLVGGGGFDDLGRGFAHGEEFFDLEAFGAESGGEIEEVVGPGGPAVGSVDEDEGGTGQPGEGPDMVEDGLVRSIVSSGNEDFPIHG